MSVKIDEQTGLEIAGSLNFSNDIPRLKGGSLEAKVTQKEGGSGYMVEGRGSAQLDIPGVDASVAAEYKDGRFKAEAQVGYKRGLLSGSIRAGVSNMPDGEGGTPGDTLTVYGSGTVTIAFTPWLQGTASIRLNPDGQMEVSGEIGLPDTVEVFPEKKVDKQLFSIGVDIPIVGVAVAGQRIGIFLNISGGLSASAGVGPGQLTDLHVGVTYNPEDEASARITGNAQFRVPAHAGLRLFIRGALGAGIPIVSAQAGLEVGGELGIEGEARAGAQVEWTPATGISLDALVSLTAQPKFKFDISGFVLVEADLLLTTIELYSKRWQLAAVEYGSGLQFGIRLPVKVESGKPFDLSLSDVEFITPEVDPVALIKGLVRQIA